MTIWGWAALIKYTGLNDQLIRRAMALYGFPKPVRVRQGSAYICVWDQPLVSEWLNRSKMLYFMQRRRDEIRRAEEDTSKWIPVEGRLLLPSHSDCTPR